MPRRELLKTCRNKLIELRDRLTVEVDQLLEEMPASLMGEGLSHVPTHSADRATDALDREVAVIAGEQNMRAAVLAALDRLEAGAFGRCQACGAEISEARLRAIPYAACCLRCAEQNRAT